jgi:hypothetical protein
VPSLLVCEMLIQSICPSRFLIINNGPLVVEPLNNPQLLHTLLPSLKVALLKQARVTGWADGSKCRHCEVFIYDNIRLDTLVKIVSATMTIDLHRHKSSAPSDEENFSGNESPIDRAGVGSFPEMINRIAMTEGKTIVPAINPMTQQTSLKLWLQLVSRPSWTLLSAGGTIPMDSIASAISTTVPMLSSYHDSKASTSVVHVSCSLNSLPAVMELVSP